MRRYLCASHEQAEQRQRGVSALPTGDFLPVPRSASRSCLPDLLYQAIAPGVLTPCCDFPLQDLSETVLKKRQAPHLAQKSSRQLAPCLRPCCAAPFVMWPLLISPPSSTKSYSPNPALIATSNTKQIFPITLALRVSSLHQIFFTASHSPSCRLTFYPSHPPAPFVHAGGGCCRLGCSTCSTTRSCSPPSPEMEGRKQWGSLPPADHLEGTDGRVGRAGQKGRASGP